MKQTSQYPGNFYQICPEKPMQWSHVKMVQLFWGTLWNVKWPYLIFSSMFGPNFKGFPIPNKGCLFYPDFVPSRRFAVLILLVSHVTEVYLDAFCLYWSVKLKTLILPEWSSIVSIVWVQFWVLLTCTYILYIAFQVVFVAFSSDKTSGN